MTAHDAGPPHRDLIDSRPDGDGAGSWSRWSVVQRRVALATLLLPVAAAAVALGSGPVPDWWQERTLRDVIAVEAELGVDASSLAWSPSGGGRVEYFLVLRNTAPRPASVTRVGFGLPGLTVEGRRRSAAPVPAGEVAYLPLSVQLDCRRWRHDVSGTRLAGSVRVVAASGRSAQVPTVVDAGPLLGVARTMCGLDRDLRVRELSGPVLPV